jgi:hypothetical protein
VYSHCSNSFIVALQTAYPEHSQIWKEYKQKGYWKDVENQRLFFDQIVKKLNIQTQEDWQGKYSEIIEAGGNFVNVHYNGSLVKGNL